MSRPLPHVSDHAVLRYLERAHGVPVEAVRQLLALAGATGKKDGAVVVGTRIKLVLESGVVVTCLKPEWRLKGDRQRRRK